MPEIALGGLSALDVPPGVIKPARRGGSPNRGSKARPRLRKFRAHAALVVGSAAFSALMIGIVLNATVMQKEHHPAPLFGSAPAAGSRVTAAPPQQPAPPPPLAVGAPVAPTVPVTAAVAPAPAPAKANAVPSESPATPPKGKSSAATPRPAKKGDAIAHLLGRPAPAQTGSKPKPAPAPAKATPAPVQPVHSRPLPPVQ